MIPIFDLDDTLYDELTFVRSGFKAVAVWGEDRFGADRKTSFAELNALLASEGRGHLFDRWLAGRAPVKDAVKIYRHHTPDIALWASAVDLLDALHDRSLYLVTDGHKVVQAKKVEALGIAKRFRHCYITHRYGIAHAKPSTHCFELIRKRERCGWDDMAYIADNPAKDFVNLTPLGVHTVRVLTGQHRDVVAKPGYDATYRIASLDQIPTLLATFRP